MDKTYYTVNEIAASLKMNRKSVVRLISSGKLGAFQVGREYRVTEEDLQQYIRTYRVVPKGHERST